MKWIEWAKELQAISQTGQHYASETYDLQRYERLGEISAEIIAGHSNLDVQEILRFNAAEFGYATPKVDVRGVVFNNDKVLLVREIMDDNKWTLPGGWADINESPSESVVREVREESGFDTKTTKLLAVYDREKQKHQPPFPYHIYKMFFLCKIVGGEATPSDETSEVDFFGMNEIPVLSDGRVKKQQILRFYEHFKNPSLPTSFD